MQEQIVPGQGWLHKPTDLELQILARFNPDTGGVTWFHSNRGLDSSIISRVLIDREGRVWAASERGLYVAPPPYNFFRRVTELTPDQFWSMAEGGNGLSHDEILALAAEESGELWVGYRFGGEINEVAPVAAGIRVTHAVPQRRGGTRLVYFLGFDSRKQLWAGTEHGVEVFDGAIWSHIDMNDGLIWDDCDLNGFAVAPNGEVWIGTSGGLGKFTPSANGSGIAA